MKISWTKKALKQLLSIDSRYKKAIKNKVADLAGFPTVTLDIKKLQGMDSQYRLRVGDYRVIFEIINDVPVIITILEVKRRTSKTY